jgi:hypothetical protein
MSSIKRSKRFRFFSRKSALLCGWGVAVLAVGRSEAAKESIHDGAGVKQVFERAEGCHRRCGEGLGRRGQIGPIGGDQRFTAIRQNQNQMQSAMPMDVPKNSERLAFERMAGTDNGDSLEEVVMMGSVSYVPLGRWITKNCSRSWPNAWLTVECFV